MDSADYFKHIQNPIRIQSALHWIHLQRWFGSEFKQDVIDIHDLCETIPTINLLSWIMACLWQVCGRLVTSVRVYFESLHSALLFYRCWERKRLFLYRCWLFSGDWEEWYNITKENYDGLIVLLIQFDVKLQPVLVGQTPEQLSSIILVNWYICRYFYAALHFAGRNIMCYTHTCHNLLRICLHVVPYEHDRCASSVHHNKLHVNVLIGINATTCIPYTTPGTHDTLKLQPWV